MESAHSEDGFQSVTNPSPRDWIRIVEDANGNAILIEEEVPNDVGPCSNYLWVRLDRYGFLRGEYLRLPSASTGSTGGIHYEYPRVRTLSGEMLTYEFTGGERIQKKLHEIEKAERPMPPG
jgi:hypothetical protein